MISKPGNIRSDYKAQKYGYNKLWLSVFDEMWSKMVPIPQFSYFDLCFSF